MVFKKEFLNKLRDFGLNSYESKLWTALLSRGVSTAGELSDIANVPRSRSYDVLESLEKKGFILMKVGKPIKYVAVPPSEVVERVKKQIKENADKQITVINSIKESNLLQELNVLHNKGIELIDPADLSGCIKGRNNFYDQLESMIKSAEKSITLMTTSHGLITKAEKLKNAFEKANKKGVTIRIVAPITKETEQAVSELSKFAEIRHSNEKSRFCVIDGKQVAFMLLDDEKVHPTYDSGIWVNTRLFAETLENLFNHSWSKLKSPNKFIKAA